MHFSAEKMFIATGRLLNSLFSPGLDDQDEAGADDVNCCEVIVIVNLLS